jgi:hypothetical protein
LNWDLGRLREDGRDKEQGMMNKEGRKGSRHKVQGATEGSETLA